MKLAIYKPNAKNTGSAFSFDLAVGRKDMPVLFVNMVQQYSWNDQYKNGSFKENAKNPEKSAVIMLTPHEAGEIISSLKSRIPFTAFHKKEDSSVIINFTPWDKDRRIKGKDGEKVYSSPAFGFTVTKNSSQKFSLSLEAGEAEMLGILMKEYIIATMVASGNLYSQSDSPSQEKPSSIKTQENKKDISEDDDIPF